MNSVRIIGGISIVALPFLMAACEYEPPHDAHGCDTFADSAFTILELTLDHSDSRACEMNHDHGDTISSGGDVYEFSATYPTLGYADRLFVTPYEGYSFSNPWEGLGGTLGAMASEYFGWGPHPDPFETTQIWQAGGVTSYVAGESPDYIEHLVWIKCCPLPWDEAYGVLEVIHSGGGGDDPGPVTED